MAEREEMRGSRLAMFASPGIPLAAMGLPLVVFLPPYYAGELGLDLATVGLIFFIARAVDMPLDPVLGALMDRTRSRMGRFPPWVIGGVAVLLLSIWQVFMVKPGIGPAYLLGWLLLLYLGYSMLVLSHMAWAGTLSRAYHGRSRVYSFVQGAHMVGLITVLLLPAIVGQSGSAAPGVQAMGWFILVMLLLTALPVAVTMRDDSRAPVHARGSLAEALGLMRNRTLLWLLAADLAISMAGGLTGALFRFFFEGILGFTPAQSGLLLIAYFVAGLLAIPLWLRLAGRIGKPRAALLAAGVSLVFNTLLIAVPRGDFWIALAALFAAGLPYAVGGFLLRAMLADFGDERRLAVGDDQIGLLNAILTTTQKVGYALPVGFVYPILGAAGFDPAPGAPNSDAALNMLIALWVIGTGTALVIAMLCFARLPFTPEWHRRLQQALEARS